MEHNATPPLAQSPLQSAASEFKLAEHADAIRALGKQTVANIIEIGCRLTDAKNIAGHGNWLPWLDREFGWKEQTARNFMRAYELSLKSPKFADLALPLSGLYLLAAPSTPPEAHDEIIERAEAVEALPVAEVKRVVEKDKDHAGGSKQLAKKKTIAAKKAEREQPAKRVKPVAEALNKTPRRTRLERELDAGAFDRLCVEQQRNSDLAEKLRAAEMKVAGLKSEVAGLKAERDQLRAEVAELQVVLKMTTAISALKTEKLLEAKSKLPADNDPGPIPECLRRRQDGGQGPAPGLGLGEDDADTPTPTQGNGSDPDASAKATDKITAEPEQATSATANGDGLDIPECLRRDRVSS